MMPYFEQRMRASNPRERWEIACEGRSNDHMNEIKEALEWAKAHGLKVERPIYPKDCHEHNMAGKCDIECGECDRVKWIEF